jgi:ubiquinone/menaquinone biosynthesis C-methylase UbiE/ADP-ribose pyrophosphatase YjhB (NUDIX family)
MNMFSTKATNGALEELLESFYGTTIQRNSYLIKTYGDLYALPSFEKDYQVDPKIFTHCTKTVNFVTVALYNSRKEFLIVYSPTVLAVNEPVGWRLLGGPIYDRNLESIEEAVNRIVRKEVALDVAELEPIATLRNSFHWAGNTIEHVGLAFIARAVGEIKEVRHQDHRCTKEPPEKMAFLNREVFVLASEKLKHKFFDPPLEEVECPKRALPLRIFHKLIFKPVTYRFASKPLKNKIKSLVANPRTLLDVAAGDDALILELASESVPEVCVANDISWKQMETLRANAKNRALNILFTNHNVAELPFAGLFDTVIFKNTLHHIRNREELLAVLKRLKVISRRLIIVDVEDPRRGRLSKIFNYYYEHVLGDGEEDHHFFTRDTFQKLIRLVFSDAHKIQIDKIGTIKGTYMIAVIDVLE